MVVIPSQDQEHFRVGCQLPTDVQVQCLSPQTDANSTEQHGCELHRKIKRSTFNNHELCQAPTANYSSTVEPNVINVDTLVVPHLGLMKVLSPQEHVKPSS